MEEKQCPKCGSTELAEGTLSGLVSIQPIEKFWTSGSPVHATVCSDCGYILSMWAKEPHIFKNRK